MNKSDSERISSLFKKIGYKPTSKTERADLVIVVACSVRQSAIDRIYGLIPRIEKLKKRPKTILTGCISNPDIKKLKNSFDYILSIKSLKDWPKFIRKEQCIHYPNPREDKTEISYFKIEPDYQNKFSAFVPIMTGCDNFCTFCIVPFTRGPEKNRDHKDIIGEIKNLIKLGYKEIWLLGQNVNSYKSPQNKSIDFPELLKLIDKIKGNFWIRFTSSHPKNMTERLIEIMAKSEKITDYLNLPVQSGNNEILKKMNRPYNIEQYKKSIKRIRKKIPNIFLSTDVIVGFPGETKNQFQNTANLFKEIKYDMAYISRYSPRPQTAAAKIKGSIPEKEKEKRKKILTNILKKTALNNNKKYIGKTTLVLPSRQSKEFLMGKTKDYRTIKFKGHKNLIGKFTKVKITEALPWGLKGTWIHQS